MRESERAVSGKEYQYQMKVRRAPHLISVSTTQHSSVTRINWAQYFAHLWGKGQFMFGQC